jgi:hypothetical protein
VGDPALAQPERKRSGSPAVIILVVALLAIAIAAGVLLFSPRGSPPQPAASAAATAPTSPSSNLAPAATVSPRRSTGVAAPLPVVNDISCDALESTIFHIHVHLAIFVDGQEKVIPFGVGIGQPWEVSDSDRGPFVTDGSCFYWIHTHTEDGVLHVESPIRRTFTLGDFFDIWQQPLSATQMGPVQGPIIAYVNGTRVDTDPADIRLLPHGRIQLDSGQDVPPYAYDFPPGD